MRRAFALAALLALSGSLATFAWGRSIDWADAEAARTPAFAASRAICAALKGKSVPPADAPDAAAAAALADCSSEALYFGIGRPADPAAARLCAVVEERTADPQVQDLGFTGDRTLMMVYANGLGVPRDLALATALACRAGGAPAEVDARVRRLARLKAQGWAETDFSLCDDVRSDLLAGTCADHDQLVARAARAKVLGAIEARWSPKDRAAFVPLARAAAAFADAHGQSEAGAAAKGRAAVASVEAEERQETAFVALLEAAEAGALPPATPSEAAAAARAGASASAERAWQHYRDAWLGFARVRYPTLSPEALSTRLAQDRATQLDGMRRPRPQLTP